MLSLEIYIFLNVILKLSLRKSIINLCNFLLLNKIIIELLNKICLSCIHDKEIFILKTTDNSILEIFILKTTDNIFNKEFKK